MRSLITYGVGKFPDNVLITYVITHRVHLSTDPLYSLVRKVLFLLPADFAHEIGMLGFRSTWPWSRLSQRLTFRAEMLQTTLCGAKIDSPIGLAAGYDKDGDLLGALMSLDFAFITVGSITHRPRKGNQKPRIARLAEKQGLVNALGLPSKGLGYALDRIKRTKRTKPIIGSIAGFALAEYQMLFEGVRAFADMVEINIGSPTFPESDFPSDVELLGRILEKIGPDDRKLTFIKIPPYQSQKNILDLVDLCAHYRVGGITATNTRRVSDRRLFTKKGGLSGRPLFENTKRTVSTIRRANNHIQIIASGGVFSGHNALELIGSGANAISILTAFIYRGPTTPKQIKLELLRELKKNRFQSVDEATGYLLRS